MTDEAINRNHSDFEVIFAVYSTYLKFRKEKIANLFRKTSNSFRKILEIQKCKPFTVKIRH